MVVDGLCWGGRVRRGMVFLFWKKNQYTCYKVYDKGKPRLKSPVNLNSNFNWSNAAVLHRIKRTEKFPPYWGIGETTKNPLPG